MRTAPISTSNIEPRGAARKLHPSRQTSRILRSGLGSPVDGGFHVREGGRWVYNVRQPANGLGLTANVIVAMQRMSGC